MLVSWGEKSDGKGNGLGVGQEGDPSPTLTKGDHHAVVSWNGDTTPKALAFKQGDKNSGVCGGLSEDSSPPITTGQDHQMVCSWNGDTTPQGFRGCIARCRCLQWPVNRRQELHSNN